MGHRFGTPRPQEEGSMKSLSLVFFTLFICSSLMAESTAPLTWNEHFAKGLDAFEKGSYEAALSAFEKASSETSNTQLVQFNRALTHQALGETDLAEKHYQLVLHEDQPLLSMKAHYQMGHLFFNQAIYSGNNDAANAFKLDQETLEDSSFHFRECRDLYYRYQSLVGSEGKTLHDQAEANDMRIAARYKHMLDQMNKKRGEKAKLIQGIVQVNGRAVDQTRVYIKSKWEDKIYGHTFSDNTGAYTLEDLPVGKYQLAAALFDTDRLEDLQWETEVKVPTRTEDTHDLQVKGAQTLAMPYQSSTPSLSAPWDDHLRKGGGETLTTEGHWGELTDGFPESSLSDNTDLDRAYLAFDVPRVQIGLAVPEIGGQDGAPKPQAQAGDNVQPPQYKVTIKGFRSDEVSFPSTLRVMGFPMPDQGQENAQPKPPVELTIQKIEFDDNENGPIAWTSEAFQHQGFRSIVLDLERLGGQRMSLHEIEVSEIQDQEGQDQDSPPQDDQNQEQENEGDQSDQDQQSPPQKEETSRPTRAILQDIRKKNEEAKERQMGSGIIISTDKDF
jgi:tetratricopeptide (TPR) repeat protein